MMIIVVSIMVVAFFLVGVAIGIALVHRDIQSGEEKEPIVVSHDEEYTTSSPASSEESEYV